MKRSRVGGGPPPGALGTATLCWVYTLVEYYKKRTMSTLFRKCETNRELSALALMCVAEAVVYTSLDEYECEDAEDAVRVSWLEECSKHSGFRNLHELMEYFNNLRGDLRVYAPGSSSSKWSQNVMNLLGSVHCVKVDRIDESTKASIRGLKCQLCGQYEHCCENVVHFIGGKGEASHFLSEEWFVDRRDPCELLSALATSWEFLDSRRTQLKEADADDLESAYAGNILPGITCYKRLIMMLNAQNFVADAFIDTHRVCEGLLKALPIHSKRRPYGLHELEIDPLETVTWERVTALASKLEAIHNSQKTLRFPVQRDDKDIWRTVFGQYDTSDRAAFLAHGHKRMGKLLEECTRPLKYSLEDHGVEEKSEEEEDDVEDELQLSSGDEWRGGGEGGDSEEEDEVVARKRSRAAAPRPPTKRRAVVASDDEDDGARPSSSATAICLPWGQTEASGSIQAAFLRAQRGVGAPLPAAPDSLSKIVDTPELWDTVLKIRRLRAPPNKLLPSRNKTIMCFTTVLADLAERGNLKLVSLFSNVLSKLASAVLKAEAGAETKGQSASFETMRKRDNVDEKLMRTMQLFRGEGHEDLSDHTAAVILTVAELL